MAESKGTAPWKVLLVDDEQSALQMYGALLREDGIPVLTAATAERARALAAGEPRLGLVVLDLVLPDVVGLELFRALRAARPEVPIVILTAFGSVDSAVQAMHEGAFTYLTKAAAEIEQWRSIVRGGLEKRALEEENRALRERLGEAGAGELIGRSAKMAELRERLASYGGSQATVLIQGESGTGKELAARAIHRASPRWEGPFVGVNCGALPAQLLESELFGYEKGAFTGAVATKPGLFELAHGGTVFLDEIGECSPELQVRLLRVLQEREVQRLGGTRPVPTDFRLVAATNRRLEEEVKAGRFREDLFYRVNVMDVAMPPLRERRDDVPLLAAFFLERFSRREGKALQGIGSAALERLVGHEWPGNVRELENAIERGVVVARGPFLEVADLPPHLRPAAAAAPVADFAGRDVTLAEVEKALVAAAMERHGGNKSQAARVLGISRKLLYSKLREHGLGGGEAPDAEEA
ncbi:MAG TPA: sigma 54-interacting transcriptional regulator [bacterium]